MDWGRAKSVLICAFLLLNGLLGYQLWVDVRDQAQSNLDFTSLSDNAQQAMEEKHIQVTAQIPRDTPILSKVIYQYNGQDVIETPIKLKSSVDSQLIFNEDELRNQLADEIPDIENYRYDPLVSEESVFMLHPLINSDLPLFNMNLQLYYSNQKITSYTEPQWTVSTNQDQPKQEIISASNALGSLIEKEIPESSVIKDIALGFYGQTLDSTHQLAVPVWRIALDSGAFYYVQAINGEVIVPPAAENKE